MNVWDLQQRCCRWSNKMLKKKAGERGGEALKNFFEKLVPSRPSFSLKYLQTFLLLCSASTSIVINRLCHLLFFPIDLHADCIEKTGMFRSCKVSSTSLFNKWESHKDKMRKNQGQRTHKKTCPQSHSNTTYTFFRNDCLASLYAKVYKASIQTNTNVKIRYFQDCSDIFVKLTNGISGDNLLPCFESHEFLHSMNSFL